MDPQTPMFRQADCFDLADKRGYSVIYKSFPARRSIEIVFPHARAICQLLLSKSDVFKVPSRSGALLRDS